MAQSVNFHSRRHVGCPRQPLSKAFFSLVLGLSVLSFHPLLLLFRVDTASSCDCETEVLFPSALPSFEQKTMWKLKKVVQGSCGGSMERSVLCCSKVLCSAPRALGCRYFSYCTLQCFYHSYTIPDKLCTACCISVCSPWQPFPTYGASEDGFIDETGPARSTALLPLLRKRTCIHENDARTHAHIIDTAAFDRVSSFCTGATASAKFAKQRR